MEQKEIDKIGDKLIKSLGGELEKDAPIVKFQDKPEESKIKESKLKESKIKESKNQDTMPAKNAVKQPGLGPKKKDAKGAKKPEVSKNIKKESKDINLDDIARLLGAK